MAQGLNLASAVRSYQQGVEWRQEQEKVARAQQAQAIDDEARAAFQGRIKQSQQTWAQNGAQGTWKPNDETMLAAGRAASNIYLQRGHMEGFMRNEAGLQAQRQRIRGQALQRYSVDGDGMALARSVMPTLSDDDVAGIERTGGMPALPSIGREATPEGIKVKFASGQEQEWPIDKLVASLKTSMVDPATAAKEELEARMKGMVARIQADEGIRRDSARADREDRQIVARGEQDRRTEGVKGERALTLENVKFGHAKTLAQGAQASAASIGAGHDRARIEAANIGANAPPKRGAAGAKAPTDIDTWKKWHAETVKIVGQQANTIMGAGGRIGDEETAAITRHALALQQEAADNGENMIPGDAIAAAIEAFKQRRGKPTKK